MKYYDEITKGFYDSEVHNNIPVSSIELSDIEYTSLMSGLSLGKVITVISGIPSAVLFEDTLSAEELSTHNLKIFREIRNAALDDMDIYQQVLRYNDLTAEQQTELATYRTALLDSTVTLIMPTKPTWM